MIVERFSKREVYSCENRQIFFKPVFGGARRRDLCPIGLTGSRIRHKTGKRKKRHERKNRSNLQQEFREVERKQFKAARFVEPLAKISCFGEKFQARYNKNVRLKMLAGEGVESRYEANRSGKGD